MQQDLKTQWIEFMQEFRSNSIKTLDNGPGEYQICAGSPLKSQPEVIVERDRKNCRSDAIRDDYECRKIRDRLPVAQSFRLAKGKLARLEDLQGQVWFRMKPTHQLDKTAYRMAMLKYHADNPGFIDGQKVMRELGYEQFPDNGTMQGMEGNRIHRELLAEGKLTRTKITQNLDIARSGKIPCWGYALAWKGGLRHTA